MIIQQETYRSGDKWKSPGDSCLMRREKTEKKDHTAEEVERLITALENEGFGLYSLDSDVLLSSLK